ncbi:hypothetical protein [Polyangium fumosum]|uniref:Uncharacterized protein n=1 Tax=Polyangium fumosum TaxID=889272 RepID=A0A4U1IT76_9BACT|nr:hypothetical protein [Polyangium fumosum]TKC97199.1 hypothetical protein E8A74_44085 [Polyangium fumosum]
MGETTESKTVGDVTITILRPKSRLAELAGRVRVVLGKDLPDDVAAFYERSDGLTFRATRGGVPLGEEASICGLEAAFAGFRPHRQYRRRSDYENDVEAGDLYDQPFCEELWSDGFEVASKRDLDRLNTLKRSKLLVSVPGASAWLTIDPFDPKGAPYRIGLAQDGCELFPLDLLFSDFVAWFCRFGAAPWYLAFAGKKAEKAMNIDFAAEIERSLAAYAGAFPAEVAALLQRVDRRRRPHASG